MTKRPGFALLLAAATAVASPAGAALYGPTEQPRLRFESISTVEYGRYEASGARDQGPYRFLGGQGFGQVDALAEWTPSESRSLRAQIRAVANGSDYRSPFDGVVVERLSLRYEDGEARLPLLIEAGDTFAYFSHRTLFRPLKGVQLEVQPDLGARRVSSLQLVVGSYASSWRSLDLDEDLSAAVSWLIEGPRAGRLSASWVHNRAMAGTAMGGRREQDVLTIAAERTLRIGSESLRLEGEAGALAGDPAPGYTAAPPRAPGDRGNSCLFLALSGRGRSPLSYAVRFEQYGEDFQPAGGTVYSDRRSAEAHAAWRLGRGGELRGRLQSYRDFRETLNPADTDTIGGGYSGRLPGALGGMTANADFFLQDLDSRDGALDARLWTLQADLYGARVRGFAPRIGLFLQDRDDHTVRAADSRTAQILLSGDRPLGFHGLRGTVSPGLLLRAIRNGATASNDVQPTLALPLYRGRHSLQQSLSFLSQDRRAAAAVDVGTFVYRLLYRYTLARDVFSLDVDTQDRNPDAARGTTSLRAVVAWTHRLERVSGRASAPGGLPTDAAAAAGPIDLAQLRPGADIDSIRQRIASAGLGPGSRLGDLTLYEARLLPDIDQRQRLVLVEKAGVLEKAALIIDADATGGGEPLGRAFARVRDRLAAGYGRPAAFFEVGELTGDDGEALARGTLVRIAEWYREGGILRFGIPRRLDGQVRMELQMAAEFPSYGDPAWSIEEAR